MRELSLGNDLAKPTALLCSAVIFVVERREGSMSDWLSCLGP